MTFAAQLEADLTEFFDTEELAESGTLNGVAVDVVVAEEGSTVEGNSAFDFLDVCFQVADYTTITYMTDALVLRGGTWKRPVLQAEDTLIKTVRFRKNERPNGWK